MKNSVAIQGYDPVAYFSNKASKGTTSHSYTHKGVTYHFSSVSNLNKFKANPRKYEPQYGGWCAFALALDAGKVKINPKRFKIVRGKLYLFYHTAIGGNTLKQWNNKKDDQGQINKADKVWKKVIQ